MSKRREIEEREQARARKQTMQIAGIIGAIAIVVIGGAILLNYLGLGGTPRSTSAIPLPAVRDVAGSETPPNADARGTAWGPANAPVKIEEFVDYQCPACGAQWARYEKEIVNAFAASGKVRFEVKYKNLIQTFKAGSTESLDSANAAFCAADQDKFWRMHDLLMGNQIDENAGQFSKQRLKDLGTKIQGLDQTAYGACVDAGTHNGKVNALDAEGDQRGVDSTPTFFINGKKLASGGKSVADLKTAIAEIAPEVKLD
jgi:protein-disulfide isomerase